MIDLVRMKRFRVEHANGAAVTDDVEHADAIARELDGLVRRVEVEVWVASCAEAECGWRGNPADERDQAADQLNHHRAEAH